MSTTDLVYGLNTQITAPGSLGIGNVRDEAKVRFVTAFCGPANVFRVRARIIGQGSWTNLVDLIGNVNQVVDVLTWDEIEVVCLVYDSTAASVKIVATSYDNSVSATFVLPGGEEIEGTFINFISSDNSVGITGNPLTGEIDFTVGSAASGKYVDEFITTDWVLNVDRYEFEILESTHNLGLNPEVQVYELDSGIYDIVDLEVEVNTSGDIKLIVSQIPDLRFNGKVILS
jgi:hypothetical protein